MLGKSKRTNFVIYAFFFLSQKLSRCGAWRWKCHRYPWNDLFGQDWGKNADYLGKGVSDEKGSLEKWLEEFCCETDGRNRQEKQTWFLLKGPLQVPSFHETLPALFAPSPRECPLSPFSNVMAICLGLSQGLVDLLLCGGLFTNRWCLL